MLHKKAPAFRRGLESIYDSSSFAVQTMCSSSSCFCVIPRRQEPSGVPRDSIMLGGQSPPAQTRLRRDLRAKRRGAHMRARSRPKNFALFLFLCGTDDVQFIELLLRGPQTAGAVRGPRDLIMLGGQSSPAQTRLRRDLRAKRRGAHMRARSRPKNFALFLFLCGADDVQFVQLLLRGPQTAGAVRGPP